MAEKSIFIVPDRHLHHPQASQLKKYLITKYRRSDPICCLATKKLARSVFAHKKQFQLGLAYSFERTARVVEFGNSWHKSAGGDQDKQQTSLFVIHFIVNYYDQLDATAALSSRLPIPKGFGILHCHCGFVRSLCNLWHLGSFLDTSESVLHNPKQQCLLSNIM